MRIKSRIRLGNQLPIETSLRNARLVSCYKQYGITPPIKGKGDAPNAASRIEPKLFHVGVPRTSQCIDTGPFCLRPELLYQFRLSKQLNPDLDVERRQLQIKFRRGFHSPHAR